MSNITPNTFPFTPLDKVKDISSNLGTLLDSLQPRAPAVDLQDCNDPNAKVFTDLIQCFHRQQTAIENLSNPPTPSTLPTQTRSQQSPSSIPDYFNNAKYEDIVCRPLKPLYDGTPDSLVPFLNRLDIRRHDEGWGSITYLRVPNTDYDLLRQFSQVEEAVILREAKSRWEASTVTKDKHTLTHPTFNSRLLAKLFNG